MKAADVMQRNVVMVSPATPLREAARLMVERRVSGLPVVDSAGHLLGIVSEGDLLHRYETGTERTRSWWLDALAESSSLADDFIRSHGTTVADVMTRKVHTVSEDTALAEVADILDRRKVKRVPVVTEGRIVGIVSRADLLRAYLKEAAGRPAGAAADGDLRDRVDAAIARQPWAANGLINVSVDEGTVRVGGIMSSVEQKRALQIAIEEVPGVKQVRNEVIVRQPIYGY